MNPDPKFQDKKRYVRVKFQGASCVVEPHLVAQLVAEDFSEREPGEEFTTEDVWMTPNEYETMPEFMGW
jgi:hypothetical protein